MNKKTGILFIIVGVVLLISAAVLAGYYSLEGKNAAKQSAQIMSELHSAVDEPSADSNDDKANLPVKMINGYEYIGYISVKQLKLELPVMASCDYTRLKYAPCRYSGWASTNDLVIAGHNYKGHFGKLTKIEIGDNVTFTDMSSTVYEYEVGDIEVLQPNDVEEMVSSSWDLTLYTCTYGAENRIAVRCRQVNV